MSCTVSELPSGCHLRGISTSSSSVVVAAAAAAAAQSGGGGSGSNSGGLNTGGIHVGGKLTTTSAMGATTTSLRGGSTGNAGASLLPETMMTGTTTTTAAAAAAAAAAAMTANTTQRQQQQSQKPCCFCWCCCCSCSWAKCLAIKNAEDNAPTRRDPASMDLLLDGEQPSLEEIRSWGKNFDLLMKNAAGRKVFRDFLRSEFSEENILFWLACEELKKENSSEAIEEKARLIYEDYISILSPREVSLDSRVREIVNRNMVEPTTHTFDEAQIQIYTLMHRDSYPRFLNSQKFKALAQLQDGSLSAAASTTDSPT
ncbi:PREDICTED: regulator of G-protein signaling 17 [Rhagoletis zephyria]|uniref:regulator of G-protein signaling 17 n=1 Tax=Rhagoletis zephyria TaxID=28612 RepID=UPI00081179CA|nr:PREDICTED: regulator of G-protein signaling 17 [Rhagoletis zephyria]XP_017471165.1 PREDICTED: regulator of G-protein signaling 17 [Rhagoletis zephyria]XP_017471236.1 PREDICTED: regulator of G-protein signaling 17 [Rhagoletis zephyria]